MPRLRFGLRLLLALPACIAAFYGGWTAHRTHLSAVHHRDALASLQRQAVLWEEIQQIQLQQRLRAKMWRDYVDHVEHLQRVRAFERMLQDPIEARMFPNGGF